MALLFYGPLTHRILGALEAVGAAFNQLIPIDLVVYPIRLLRSMAYPTLEFDGQGEGIRSRF